MKEGIPSRGFPMRGLINSQSVRHELGLLSMIVMEVSWLVPWLQVLSPIPGGWSSIRVLILLVAFALVPLISIRYLVQQIAPPLFRAILQIGLIMGGLILGLKWILFQGVDITLGGLIGETIRSFARVFDVFPSQLALLLAMIYSWWRGTAAANTEALHPRRIGLRFRAIVLTLALYGLFFRADRAHYLTEILPFTFGASILVLAINRAEDVSRRMEARRSPFSGGWLAAVALIVLVITTIGVFTGLLLQSPEASHLALLLGHGITTALRILISPMLLIMLLVSIFILQRLGGGEGADFARAEDDENLIRLMTELKERTSEISEWLAWLRTHGDVITILLVSILIGSLILFVIYLSRRAARMKRNLDWEEGEDIFSSQALLDDLKERFQGLVGVLDPRKRFSALRRVFIASMVRRIYIRFLSMAESKGLGREISETALEFANRFSEFFPGYEGQAANLTEAYMLVRYGDFPEDELDLEQVRRSWWELRRGFQSTITIESQDEVVGVTKELENRGNEIEP